MKMKNVNLDVLEFGNALSREQMKSVKGGAVTCNCPGGGGTLMDCSTLSGLECADMCWAYCGANVQE